MIGDMTTARTGRAARLVLDMRGGQAFLRPAQEHRRHFWIDQHGETAIRVHSGTTARKWGREATSAVMSVDAGTPGEYSGYKAITGITTTKYVILTLSSEEAAATAAVAVADTNEELTDAGNVKWCLGKVTCEGGKITSIEQFRSGDISAPWNLVKVNGSYCDTPTNVPVAVSVTGGPGASQFTLTVETPTVTVERGRLSFIPGISTPTVVDVPAPSSVANADHADLADAIDDGTGNPVPVLGDVADDYFYATRDDGLYRFTVKKGLISSKEKIS